MRRAVDAEAHAADRHLEPDPRTLEPRRDIGRQPIERDRPLHQPPNDKDAEQKQHPGNRAKPDEAVMRAAPDPPHRCAFAGPAMRRAVSFRRLLTGFGRRASVASAAGIARWDRYWTSPDLMPRRRGQPISGCASWAWRPGRRRSPNRTTAALPLPAPGA